MPDVNIQFYASPEKVRALAQFVKRLSWEQMRYCATDDAEAYEIREAIEILQQALKDKGNSPR